MTEHYFIPGAQAVSKKNSSSPDYIARMNNLNNTSAAGTALLYCLDLSINEMNYHFNSLYDQILYNEKENAIIYFENKTSTKFGWINFRNQIPDKADTIEFFEPASGTYLILFRKSNAVYPVTLNDYNNESEFICGHYSGIYTDAKDNPIYKVSCSFNISRHAKCVIRGKNNR